MIDFLDSSAFTRRTVILEKCPDKQATIQFTMKTTLINNMMAGSETQSMMSCDIKSVDSDPESEYDFGELERKPEEENKR